MLLETLDVKKNDILIYSENKFDFESNFKIIYKKSGSRKPFSINFWEVGEYMNSPNPKNIILYRLLTNIPEFNASLTKYGTYIQINNAPEMVYYDPIFAVKELERMNGIIDFHSFRFKIHQIGLSSTSMQNGIQNYRELYHFDLKADEAKNQNDRVFAEAIFAFDNDFTDPAVKSDIHDSKKIPAVTPFPYKPLNLIISEDRQATQREMQKLDIFPDMSIVSEAREKNQLAETAKGIIEAETTKKETSIGEFLKRQKQKESVQPTKSPGGDLLSLFKSADTYVSDRSGESIVLRIRQKEN